MRVHAELFRSSTFLVVTLLLAASLVSAEKPEAAAMSKTRIVLLGTGNPAPFQIDQGRQLQLSLTIRRTLST